MNNSHLSPSPQPSPTRGEGVRVHPPGWVKLRDWRRVWSKLLRVDIRVAEYSDFKFLLEKRAGAFSGKRWRLEIYYQDRIVVRAGYPNLMVGKAKAEEWLNKNYGSLHKAPTGETPVPPEKI